MEYSVIDIFTDYIEFGDVRRLRIKQTIIELFYIIESPNVWMTNLKKAV